MTDATKRKVKKISGGMVIGIAAACLLTAGALAAALGSGLRGYFDASAPGAQEVLESGIYQLNRSQTYNGWTVTLAECVGDDTNVYIWVDVTAPEGQSLVKPEKGEISTMFHLENLPEGYSGRSGSNLMALPDEDPTDNKISFCIEVSSATVPLRGSTLDITLDPITDNFWTYSESGQAQRQEGSEMTAAIRGHEWVFENVVLDYPDQTIRLTPGVEVPYLDGTATLTMVEVSPLTTTVQIEGGSCEDHHGRRARLEAREQAGPEETKPEESESAEIVISFGEIQVSMSGGAEDADPLFDCWSALGVELHMKDGTVLPQLTPATGSTCKDGVLPISYTGVPYVKGLFQYAEMRGALIPTQVIDPTQVDHVTVCGVDVPMPEAETSEKAEEPASIWQWIFKTYWNN